MLRENLSHHLVNILRIGDGKTVLCKSCAYIVHRRKKYRLALILRIYCALEKFEERSTILCKSCAYIAHWRNNYNLVQILCIYCSSGKEVQSCTNLVHILSIGRESWANLAHILCIGEMTTILSKSCAYIVHWREKYYHA